MIILKEIPQKDKKSQNIYCELFREIWSEYYKNKFSQEMLDFQFEFLTPEIIKEQMVFDKLQFFLIEKNDKNIGFLELKRKENWIEISKIYLLKEYRLQKNGKKTFDSIKKLAKQEKKEKIIINIDEKEKETINIFTTLNFKDIKQIARYIGMETYIFCRNLEYYL